jgi:hypothetical protein
MIKSIYDFTVTKKVKKEVVEETEKGKLIQTVEEDVPFKIIFKKPNRLESEEADTIFSVEYGRCVRAGILTRPLVEKLYDDKDKSGILSEDFSGKYITLYERFFAVQNEYMQTNLKDEKTDEDAKKMNSLAYEFSHIKEELQALEASRNDLFQNTAETKAQNKTILWLTLFLTYIQTEDGKEVPFFKGRTFEEKLDIYDSVIESGDEFSIKVMDKMAFFVAIWFMGKASTKEDFSALDGGFELPTTEEKGDVESPVVTKE